LSAAQAISPTQDLVVGNIVNIAQNVQNTITQNYQNVDTIAVAERAVAANTQNISNMDAVRDSADQLYYDGIQNLREAVDTAKELHDDQ
jgi:hypothetical protein